MAYRLNEAIYNADYNELERLLREEEIDPNDLGGSESPLKTVFQVNGKPEELELLLEYGADPNIEEGSGITVFTDIIFLILSSITGRMPDTEPEYFIPYLELFLNYGVDMNKSESGHPSAIRAINDWPTDYSREAAWYRNRGIISNPHPNDIWASEQLNSIIQNILDEKEKYKTYTAKQRSALAKTGLPQNILNSIMGNLDYDTFDMIGENMLEDQYSQYAYDSMNRYYPGESYSEYREALYDNDDDDAEIEKRKVRRRKKTKKKKKKKWGKAKKGGTRTSGGMDQIPYGLRNSPEVGHEFIKAVIKDNYDRIKELMSVGGNINSKNINESSALMAATIIKKDPLMVKFLLENGADPNIKLERYGNIPLINFMTTNDIDIDTHTKKKIIEQLIKYGSTPDYNFSKGRNRSTISSAALNSREERYLREREYRNKQLGEKKLNFSKLMNYRLGETAEQPDEMENINRIGTMIDDAEDKKRDEELRGELIAEYTNILDMYGGGYRKY